MERTPWIDGKNDWLDAKKDIDLGNQNMLSMQATGDEYVAISASVAL